MLRLKKHAGMSLVTLSIYALVILVMTVFTLSPPNLAKFSDDRLKDYAGTIDVSLAQWYRFHGQTYPANLNMLVSLGILSPTVSLSSYSYSTINSNTSYRLFVTLTRGGTYTSPGSKY